MKKILFAAFTIGCVQVSYAQWKTVGTSVALDQSTNSVGIGVESTIAKLHVAVNESGLAWPVVFNNYRNVSDETENYGVGIKLKHSWNHEGYKWGGIASVQEGAWANNSGLALYANEQEYLRIRYDGNVGIGTSSPAYKLDLNGTARLGDDDESGLLITDFTNDLLVNTPGSTSGIQILGPRHSHVLLDIQGNDINDGFYVRVPSALQVNPTVDKIAMVVKATGNVGIGTTTPTSLLSVAGTMDAREIKVEVEAGSTPDYVFDDNYELSTLEETASYIQENHHLPEIPSAKEMEANGMNVGEMNLLLLKKIEELTLHLIEVKNENEKITKRIENLELR